jgi:hypothetical protein
MKLISIKSVASPVLLSGAGAQSGAGIFIQTFGEFEKVTNAMVTDDIGLNEVAISGYIATAKATIVSGNAVVIAFQKNEVGISGLNISGYAAMVSGDLISNTVTILAYGE